MPYSIKDAIDAAYNDNTNKFNDAVGDILMDKVRDRIGVEKIKVAQTFLNPQDNLDVEPETETEVTPEVESNPEEEQTDEKV